MYNDDIYSLIMAAEESMLKADLGVEDSYEAYAMECALEEAVAMEASYVESYGWDMAMEDATAAIEDKAVPQLAIGEHKATFGEKMKAAGQWVKKALAALWDKAVKLWQWLCEKVKSFIDWLFKRQKAVEDEEKDTEKYESDTDDSVITPRSDTAPKSTVGRVTDYHADQLRLDDDRADQSKLNDNRAGQLRLNDDHTRSAKGYFTSKKAENPIDDSYMRRSAHALEDKRKEALGLPDHKEFNKALPSIHKKAEIMKANQKNGVTNNDINKVQKAADTYVKALFQFIEKGLDTARSAEQLIHTLQSSNWKTLEKDNKVKEYQNKFKEIDEKISDIEKFNSETGSYKNDFNEATKNVPHWNVYVQAKTIHGYSSMVRQIYDASTKHLSFCKAFKQFIEKHSDDTPGTTYKNPQELRVDGKTVSGGVVVGSVHTNIMYEGSKVYIRASTAVNQVTGEYTKLINNIVAAS